MNEEFVTRIADAYSNHAGSYATILEPILQPLADEIARLGRLQNKEKVLDLACGTGLITRSLAEDTPLVFGVDVSFGALREARSRSAGSLTFVAGDAHILPYANDIFDCITCGLSLSHFSDVPSALLEIRRVLRPGGRFITSAWGNESYNPTKAAAVEVRNKFLEDREITYKGTFNENLWSDPILGRETLNSVGFVEVRSSRGELSGHYRDKMEATQVALAWPITRYRIARLEPVDQRRLLEQTAAAIDKVDDLHWSSELHYYQAIKPTD